MSNRYVQQLLDDLIEQFKDKPRIADLMAVVGEELQEVYDFMLQIQLQTDIQNAVGKQLDGIGDIVALSRRDAINLANETLYDYTDEDEMYRLFLYYKIFVNTAQGTYEDVMRSIHMMWKGNLAYSEDPLVPATIILDFEMFSKNNNVQLLKIPILKPAGVRLWFRSYGKLQNKLYMGATHTMLSKTKLTQTEKADLPLYLVDEENNLLLDEENCVLYELEG